MNLRIPYTLLPEEEIEEKIGFDQDQNFKKIENVLKNKTIDEMRERERERFFNLIKIFLQIQLYKL